MKYKYVLAGGFTVCIGILMISAKGVTGCEKFNCPSHCNLTYLNGCPHNCNCKKPRNDCPDVICPDANPPCLLTLSLSGCHECACPHGARHLIKVIPKPNSRRITTTTTPRPRTIRPRINRKHGTTDLERGPFELPSRVRPPPRTDVVDVQPPPQRPVLQRPDSPSFFRPSTRPRRLGFGNPGDAGRPDENSVTRFGFGTPLNQDLNTSSEEEAARLQHEKERQQQKQERERERQRQEDERLRRQQEEEQRRRNEEQRQREDEERLRQHNEEEKRRRQEEERRRQEQQRQEAERQRQEAERIRQQQEEEQRRLKEQRRQEQERQREEEDRRRLAEEERQRQEAERQRLQHEEERRRQEEFDRQKAQQQREEAERQQLIEKQILQQQDEEEERQRLAERRRERQRLMLRLEAEDKARQKQIQEDQRRRQQEQDAQRRQNLQQQQRQQQMPPHQKEQFEFHQKQQQKNTDTIRKSDLSKDRCDASHIASMNFLLKDTIKTINQHQSSSTPAYPFLVTYPESQLTQACSSYRAELNRLSGTTIRLCRSTHKIFDEILANYEVPCGFGTQKEFLRQLPCLQSHKAHPRVEHCEAQAAITLHPSNNGVGSACSAYNELASCIYDVIRGNCGVNGWEIHFQYLSMYVRQYDHKCRLLRITRKVAKI